MPLLAFWSILGTGPGPEISKKAEQKKTPPRPASNILYCSRVRGGGFAEGEVGVTGGWVAGGAVAGGAVAVGRVAGGTVTGGTVAGGSYGSVHGGRPLAR